MFSGGHFSDVSAGKYPRAVEGRLVYSLPCMWLVPLGAIGFGFTLNYGVNLGAVLITQSVLGFGQALVMPAVQGEIPPLNIVLLIVINHYVCGTGYMFAARPTARGAVGSVVWFVAFVTAAIIISIQVQISTAVGVHIFFVILAGLSGLACLWSTIAICRAALF
jgi:hypothetical protein